MRTLYVFYLATVLIVVFVLYYYIKEYRNAKKKNVELKFEAIDLIPIIGSIFALSFVAGILLAFISSDVTTIYEKDGSWEHDQTRYLVYYSYEKDGVSASFPAKWFGYRLYNASDKTVVLHPVVYGNPNLTDKERKTYTVLPHEYARIPKFPDVFFKSVPRYAHSKGTGKVMWVLLEEGQEVK